MYQLTTKQMKVIKGLGIALLGFLLSLSLIVFVLALTINLTALNPGFYAHRLDSLDVSALAGQFLEGQAGDVDLPEAFTPQLKSAVIDAIDRTEPLVKEGISAGIEDALKYLKGAVKEIDLAGLLRDNLLNSTFVADLLDKLDLAEIIKSADASSLALDMLTEGEGPDQATKYLLGYLDELLPELEPWLEEQAINAADPVFAYLLDESGTFSVSISTDRVKQVLDTTFRQAFINSPPPELAGYSRAQLEQYFADNYQKLIDELPVAYTIDQSELEATKADIATSVADVEKSLAEARQIVGFFRLGFTLLIVFILLLIAGIILIYRNVRSTSLTLGIIFLVQGIVYLAGVLVAKSLIRAPLAELDLPASIRDWVFQTAGSTLTPLLVTAIIMLVLGVGLVITYIIYPRLRPE